MEKDANLETEDERTEVELVRTDKLEKDAILETEDEDTNAEDCLETEEDTELPLTDTEAE